MSADPDATARFALKVWQYKQGEAVSLMVHLGDRLGLYRAMEGGGALTSAELAERTGMQERWLREWLKGHAGAGLALRVLGAEFPKGTFHGLDPSRFAIERAVASTDLSNVSFAVGRAEDLAAGSGYDLAISFDCLHDMTFPDRAASAVRRAIAGDGTWLIKEIRSAGDWSADQ